MTIHTESYLKRTVDGGQNRASIFWPQFDEQTIIVYQAYRPATGLFAVRNGFFWRWIQCSQG